MSQFFKVTNHEKYQHYKDRCPPWVKLHASVLEDYDFGCLPDASKAHAMLIWVLASRHNNRLPFDPRWVAQQIQATGDVDLDALVSAGFIEMYQDASTALAPLVQSTEDREERTENLFPSPTAPVAKPRKAPRTTWLTPYWDAWVARFGAEPHVGQLAKHLKRPRDSLGDPALLDRWVRYLARTDEQFVSPAKFAATHGSYADDKLSEIDALIEREKARQCG